ncbi:hypothetical protein HMPREF9418_1974 [Neisseria macacae ATCC 33926]|uniref:Uncharacterized protein n=1 Tax=Neisseria macacae ATCC 33926 TaxID=997348 RepID=A0AA36XK95_9NEIS|nr:hypothetical protein HMPREF9418_1974 [Neisseria macacae ATCC 33926]
MASSPCLDLKLIHYKKTEQPKLFCFLFSDDLIGLAIEEVV